MLKNKVDIFLSLKVVVDEDDFDNQSAQLTQARIERQVWSKYTTKSMITTLE